MLSGRAHDEVNHHRTGAGLAESRLMALLDSMHDGAWILALDGRIEFANHRLAQFFGLQPQDLAAGSLQSDVLEKLRPHLEAPDTTLARWRQLQDNPEQVGWDDLEFRRPRRRILERFARPVFDAQHRLMGRLEVFRDITSERLLEDKVVQRERLAAIGQLLTGVAHELNNPLTAVGGYAVRRPAGTVAGKGRALAPGGGTCRTYCLQPAALCPRLQAGKAVGGPARGAGAHCGLARLRAARREHPSRPPLRARATSRTGRAQPARAGLDRKSVV